MQYVNFGLLVRSFKAYYVQLDLVLGVWKFCIGDLGRAHNTVGGMCELGCMSATSSMNGRLQSTTHDSSVRVGEGH